MFVNQNFKGNYNKHSLVEDQYALVYNKKRMKEKFFLFLKEEIH